MRKATPAPRRGRPATASDPAVSTGLRDHPILTVDDVVAYLRLPKSTVYKLAQEGKIPGQKVGRHWRFHKEAIDKWLMERQTQS